MTSLRFHAWGITPPMHVDHEFLVPCNRRGHGGVAILWQKTLPDVHKLSEFASHHHIGISVCNHLKIFSTYLPTRLGCTAHLHLNTETSSHTCESESNSCISTIDHFLCPQHCLPFFSMCSTLSNLSTAANTSDHIPLVSEVTVPVQVSQPSATHSRGPTLNWKKLSEEEIKSTYTQLLESKLSTLSPPNMDICRENPQCLPTNICNLCVKLCFLPVRKQFRPKP